jgi:two-component sensor histidine kinase
VGRWPDFHDPRRRRLRLNPLVAALASESDRLLIDINSREVRPSILARRFGGEPCRGIGEGNAMRGSSFETPYVARGDPGPTPDGRTTACGDCLIVREADHRIANHLAMLAGFVRLRAAEVARQPAGAQGRDGQLLLESIAAQIEMVARLHRTLTTPGAASPDLGDHLREVCAPLVAALSGQVDFVADFQPGCVVPVAQVLPLTQIVAEALTNAIKHATRPEGRGAILASCRRNHRGALCIEVADNGGGFPDAFDPAVGGGLGFRVMRALARQLGAEIEFDSHDQGVRFRMTLPPEQVQGRA